MVAVVVERISSLERDSSHTDACTGGVGMATVFVSRIPGAASEIVDALLSAFGFDVVMRALFLVLHKHSCIAPMNACALSSNVGLTLARRL